MTETSSGQASDAKAHGAEPDGDPKTVEQTSAQAMWWLAKNYFSQHKARLTVVMFALLLQTSTFVFFPEYLGHYLETLFVTSANVCAQMDLDALSAAIAGGGADGGQECIDETNVTTTSLPSYQAAIWASVILLLLFSARALGSFIQRATMEATLARVVGGIRVDIAAHLNRTEAKEFDANDPGDLNVRISNNLSQLHLLLIDLMVGAIAGSLTVIGLFGYLLYLNWSLTFLVLFTFIFIGLGVGILNGQIKRAQQRANVNIQALGSELESTLNNQKSIRINSIGGWALDRVNAAINGNAQALARRGLIYGILAPLVDFAVAFCMVGVIFAGVWAILTGVLSAKEIISFIVAIMLLYNPMKKVVNVVGNLRAASVLVGSIRWIFSLDTEPSPAPLPGGLDDGQVLATSDLSLRDVSFAYPASRGDQTAGGDRSALALDQVSVTLPGGKVSMLVGHTGSGKSTLPSLLTGLYPIDQGDIRVGGQALDRAQLLTLRRHISYVGQEVLLQNLNLAQNLEAFNGQAAQLDEKRLNELAEFAELGDVELIAKGQPLGPRGSKLSGGQRQRVALLQNHLANKPIAILDEPTSAMDAATAHKMVKRLLAGRAGKTTIMIIHDRSLLKFADHMVELAEGKLVYSGPPTLE